MRSYNAHILVFSIWFVTHLQIENLISTFSNQDESEAMQGSDKVDDDYATDACRE